MRAALEAAGSCLRRSDAAAARIAKSYDQYADAAQRLGKFFHPAIDGHGRRTSQSPCRDCAQKIHIRCNAGWQGQLQFQPVSGSQGSDRRRGMDRNALKSGPPPKNIAEISKSEVFLVRATTGTWGRITGSAFMVRCRAIAAATAHKELNVLAI